MSRIDERLEIMGVDTSEMTDEEKFTAATGLTRYDEEMAANDWYVPAGAGNTPAEAEQGSGSGSGSDTEEPTVDQGSGSGSGSDENLLNTPVNPEDDEEPVDEEPTGDQTKEPGEEEPEETGEEEPEEPEDEEPEETPSTAEITNGE